MRSNCSNGGEPVLDWKNCSAFIWKVNPSGTAHCTALLGTHREGQLSREHRVTRRAWRHPREWAALLEASWLPRCISSHSEDHHTRLRFPQDQCSDSVQVRPGGSRQSVSPSAQERGLCGTCDQRCLTLPTLHLECLRSHLLTPYCARNSAIGSWYSAASRNT